MKKSNFNILIVLLIALTISVLSQCTSFQQVETQSPLEQRLDTLLGKMSMQEKIEQLYYKTDGKRTFGYSAI